MKIECAWCGREMGEKDGKGVEGVSHSVCEECYKKQTSHAKNSLGKVTGVKNIKPGVGKHFAEG